MRQFMAENRVNAQSQVSADFGEYKPASTFPELSGGPPQAGGPAPVQSAPPVHDAPVKVAPVKVAPVKVPNYLVQSILCTLCCCLPFGIVAIIFAAKVDGLANAGNTAAAQEASDKAKMWCWIAFGLGLVSNIIIVGIQIAAESM